MRKHKQIWISWLLICVLLCLSGCSAVTGNGQESLNIDYVGADGEVTEEEVTAGSDVDGMFGWLKEKLSSDKKGAGDLAASDLPSADEQEESGLQQIYGLVNDQNTEPAESSDGTVPEEDGTRGDQTQPRPGGQSGTPGGNAPDPGSNGSENTPAPDDGSQTKPLPPEKKNTVTFTIRCDTAVNNGMHQETKWAGIVPANGCILPVTTLEFEEGDTVFDLLCDVRDTYKLHMSYRGSNGGEYIDGINNLYEFDGGRWSGWMYCVNGWYPNYGCGQYTVKNGDVIEWNYTCDLGLDLDAGMEGAQEWKDTHD